MMAGGAHEENADLHDLYSSPLELEIHLVKVTPAGTVKKEVWEMKNDERLAEVPVVKDEGAMFYKSGDHVRAQV